MDTLVRALVTGMIGAVIVPAMGEATPPDPMAAAAIRHTDTVYEPAVYASREEWEARRERLTEQVRVASGLVPMPERTPLYPRIFDRFEWEGISIEKVYFESMPGVYVSGNLYRPLDREKKHPAIACPHGHWSQGRLNHDERGSIPVRCIRLAQMGAVVFAYDMIGYVDSGRQFEHRHERWKQADLDLWLLGTFQLQTFNSIRVLDFLESLPDVDAKRIGVTGASGGGTQTFILSAIDDRVKVAVPVNMISSTMQGGCICENAPLLRIGTNNMEIAALFAPRPLLMVSATGDWTKKTPEVEYPFVRSVYEFYGRADLIANVHVDAEHNYNKQSREAMYAFFAEHLLGLPGEKDWSEPDIQMPPVDKLRAYTDENVPRNMLNLERYIEQVKEKIHEDIEDTFPEDHEALAALTDACRRVLGISLDMPGDTSTPRVQAARPDEWNIPAWNPLTGTCDWHVSRREGRRGRERGIWSWRNVLYTMHPPTVGGLSTAIAPLEKSSQPYRPVLLSPFGLGEGRSLFAAENQRADTNFFTTFNLTDAAVFARSCVPVAPMRQIREREMYVLEGYRFHGVGQVGPVGLIVRVMWPTPPEGVKQTPSAIDMNQFDPTGDEDYLKFLFIPGIQRVGGLPVIAALAADGPLWLHNVHPGFDTRWVKQAGELNGVEVKITHERAEPSAIRNWFEKVQEKR